MLAARCLWELYVHAHPTYTGRVTVPVLWNRQEQTIVSNESSEIIRMFDGAFHRCGATSDTFVPPSLGDQIDLLNQWIYRTVNNGVYKAGFATAQGPYEEAVTALFNTLDKLEAHLSKYEYLVGSQPTEADWRLVTTLLRFDPVYVLHFKCNIKRLVDYPALWAYTLKLARTPRC